MIFFKRYFSTIGILRRATDLLPSMRAPPDMSNVIIVLKAGQSSVQRNISVAGYNKIHQH